MHMYIYTNMCNWESQRLQSRMFYKYARPKLIEVFLFHNTIKHDIYTRKNS